MEKLHAPPAFPRWWFDRTWNFNETAIVVSVPYDSLYRYVSLIRATGIWFGEKRGREWMFDGHELYALHLLATLRSAGLPVGPAHIRAVVAFAYAPDGAPVAPDVDFVMTGPASEFRIDAPAIFRAVVDATDPKHEENDGRYAQAHH